MSSSCSVKYEADMGSPTLLPNNDPPSPYQKLTGSPASGEDIQKTNKGRGRAATPCAANAPRWCTSCPVLCGALIALIVGALIGGVLIYFLAVCNSGAPPIPNKIRPEEPAQCPPDWILINRNCYFLSDNMATWTASDEFCNNNGGSLVIIQDNTKNDFKKLNVNGDFWIGLERDQNVWKWSDGTQYNETVAEDNDSRLNCAYLNNNKKVGALECDTSRRFICHKAVGGFIS